MRKVDFRSLTREFLRGDEYDSRYTRRILKESLGLDQLGEISGMLAALALSLSGNDEGSAINLLKGCMEGTDPSSVQIRQLIWQQIGGKDREDAAELINIALELIDPHKPHSPYQPPVGLADMVEDVITHEDLAAGDTMSSEEIEQVATQVIDQLNYGSRTEDIMRSVLSFFETKKSNNMRF